MSHTSFIKFILAIMAVILGISSARAQVEVIKTAEDFNRLVNLVERTIPGEMLVVRLEADITIYESDCLGRTKELPFRGSFDGNGHTITVMRNYIKDAVEYPGNPDLRFKHGVFGFVENSTIQNLHVTGCISHKQEDPDITGPVGGVADCSRYSFYKNVRSTVEIDISNSRRVGGVIGESNNDMIVFCSYEGSLNAGMSSGSVGGIVGYAGSILHKLQGCLFSGVVKSEGKASLGGILGCADCAAGDLICFNLCAGELQCAGNRHGPIIGWVTSSSSMTADSYHKNFFIDTQYDHSIGQNDKFTVTSEEKVTPDKIAHGDICYYMNYYQLEVVKFGLCETGSYRQNLGFDKAPTLDQTHKAICDMRGADFSLPPFFSNDTAPLPYHIDRNGRCTVCNMELGVQLHPDGWYEITTYEQMVEFFEKTKGKAANARLMNDIVVNDGTICDFMNYEGTWYEYNVGPSGKNPRIIDNPFEVRGTFDGQGHCIKGVGMYCPNDKEIGLFNVLTVGKVCNLGIADSRFTGRTYVGTLFGSNQGRVERCFAYNCVIMAVENDPQAAGSLIGGGSGARVNCWTTNCTYNWSDNLQIYSYNRREEQLFYYSNVSEKDCKSGKLCYKLNDGNSEGPWRQTLGVDPYPVLDVTHKKVYGNPCYGNDATGKEHQGIFLRTIAEPTCTDQGSKLFRCTSCDNEYTELIAALSQTGHPEGSTSEYCQVCRMGFKEPAERDEVYEISTLGELLWYIMQNYEVTKSARLMNDIVANDGVIADDGSYTPGASKEPLLRLSVNYYRTLSADFNGQGHSISGLYIVATELGRAGLFGLNNNTISNLTIRDSYFKHDGNILSSYSGAIAGENSGHIDGCMSINNKMICCSGYGYAGGIAGKSFLNRNVSNCATINCKIESDLFAYAMGAADKVENCWTDYYKMSNADHITNSYSKSLTDPDVTSGKLCYMLNSTGSIIDGIRTNGWYQQIGEDPYPHRTKTATNTVYYDEERNIYYNKDINGNAIIIDNGENIGDVNHDGDINIKDIEALCDIILHKTEGTDGNIDRNADINGDGVVNIADIAALVKKVGETVREL